MRQIILSLCLLVCAFVEALAFDTTTPPPGVWTDERYKPFWEAHKLSNSCLTTVKDMAPDRVLKPYLTPISDTALAAKPWHDIYPSAKGMWSSYANGVLDEAPKPIAKASPIDATLHYGDREASLDYAQRWFAGNSTKARFEGPEGPTTRKLKRVLLDWAKADALRGGLGNPDMPTNIDFVVTTLLMGIENSLSAVAPTLDEHDKAIMARWMNRLMRDVSNAWFGNSNKVDRVANGPFRQAHILLIWALMIDDDAAIQRIIDIYKTAIHDMRPDGTFPLDSNRGGMGLKYQNIATNHLVMIASLLKVRRDVDLFSYNVNGRSVHTAVDWVVRSVDDMSRMNAIYARPCRWGDRYGTVTKPSRGYLDDLPYLVVYARLNPQSSYHDEILRRWGNAYTKDARILDFLGGAPVGLFGISSIEN